MKDEWTAGGGVGAVMAVRGDGTGAGAGAPACSSGQLPAAPTNAARVTPRANSSSSAGGLCALESVLVAEGNGQQHLAAPCPPQHLALVEPGGVGSSSSTAHAHDACDATNAAEGDALALMSLLQELLSLSALTPVPPLSRAMALIVGRLPVDWAALHGFSCGQRVVLQVGAALSPEAQRQRGASGSAYATPVGSGRGVRTGAAAHSSTPGGGLPFPGGSSTGGSIVQELGGCGPAQLLGSGSSLDKVAGSGAALALHVPPEGIDAVSADLPWDWARLARERDLRSFLCVPIIGSGCGRPAGRVIGALSLGQTSAADWSSAWWMPSIQLLSGWAAGALHTSRATVRACFFDALWAAPCLEELGRVVVERLGPALAGPEV